MHGWFRKMQARFTIHHGSCWSWDAVSPLSLLLATLPAAVHSCCKSEHNVGKWCHTNRAGPWHNRAGLNIHVNSCACFFWERKDTFWFVLEMLLSIHVSFLMISQYSPDVLTWKTATSSAPETHDRHLEERLCLLHLDWLMQQHGMNRCMQKKSEISSHLKDVSVHQWPSRWYVMTRLFWHGALSSCRRHLTLSWTRKKNVL